MQALSSDSSVQCSQVQSCIRPVDCGISSAAGPYGDRGSGPNRPGELEGSRQYPGFPDLVSLTVVPYSSSDLLTCLM